MFHEVESAAEGGGVSVRFDDRWYRTADDFFLKAELEDELAAYRKYKAELEAIIQQMLEDGGVKFQWLMK